MKPLSFGKCITRNRKKFSVILVTITFGIILLYISNMIITSMNVNIHRDWAEPFRNVSVIEPTENEVPLQGKDVYKSYIDRIFITGTTGRTSTYIFFLDEDGMEYAKQQMNFELIEGRMPEQGTNEIVIHTNIMKNKNLHVGGTFGSDVDSGQVLLGSYKIVGVIDGTGIFSLGSLEYYGKKNKDVALGRFFDRRYTDELMANDGLEYKIYSYDKEVYDINNFGKVLRISLYLLIAFVILVISFTLAFIVYIYYLQRRQEFGILMAIGYNAPFILQRSFKEMLSVVCAAEICGTLLSLFIGKLLNLFIMDGWGQSLVIANAKYLVWPIVLGIVLVLISYFLVWRVTKKVDCIAIIEGES